MYLIQFFLPLFDQEKRRFPRERFKAVEDQLLASFKGFTAYPRAPATGLWENHEAELEHDDLIVYEVMAEQIDHPWWSHFRRSLEAQFSQEELLIRTQVIEII